MGAGLPLESKWDALDGGDDEGGGMHIEQMAVLQDMFSQIQKKVLFVATKSQVEHDFLEHGE
jgi:hypothetical protein